MFGIIKVCSSDGCDGVCAVEGWPWWAGGGDDRLCREDTTSYALTGCLHDIQRAATR